MSSINLNIKKDSKIPSSSLQNIASTSSNSFNSLPHKLPTKLETSDVEIESTKSLSRPPIHQTSKYANLINVVSAMDKISIRSRISGSSDMACAASSSPSKKKIRRDVPAINCKEKIIFCIDISKEMMQTTFAESDDQQSRITFIQCFKKGLTLFLKNKSKIDSNHEYSVIFLTSTSIWMTDFTTNIDIILNSMKNIPEADVVELDMNSLFRTIQQHITLKQNHMSDSVKTPFYIYRAILIYGRQFHIPAIDLIHNNFFQESEQFVLDVVYLYNPSIQDNNCEEIFDSLCNLDFQGVSYIIAVSKPSELFQCFAQMLGHPNQRPTQQTTYLKLDR